MNFKILTMILISLLLNCSAFSADIIEGWNRELWNGEFLSVFLDQIDEEKKEVVADSLGLYFARNLDQDAREELVYNLLEHSLSNGKIDFLDEVLSILKEKRQDFPEILKEVFARKSKESKNTLAYDFTYVNLGTYDVRDKACYFFHKWEYSPLEDDSKDIEFLNKQGESYPDKFDRINEEFLKELPLGALTKAAKKDK